jgi:hypothetical protein
MIGKMANATVQYGTMGVSKKSFEIPKESAVYKMPSKQSRSRKLKALPSRTRASRKTSPDDLWELYTGRKVKLTIKMLPEEKPEGLPLILLEGDRTSLEWLADFILASAAFKRDCGSFAAPDGPGNRFFNRKKSQFGIYIHRLPCMERNGGPLG